MGKCISKRKRNKDKNEKNNKNGFLRSTTLKISNNTIINKSNNNINENYTIIKKLGEGAFSSVYLVQNIITGKYCAMKTIKIKEQLTSNEEQEIMNEIFILKSLDHPNIFKIFEFYKNLDEYNLITEYCEGGDLFHEIHDKGPFSEDCSAYIIYQILSAVNFFHKMNIIHRDIKPENILISDRNEDDYPRLKICDFGASKILEKGQINQRFIGSSYYIAPEVIRQNYNEKCDLWSCGVILYIMLIGSPPFKGDDEKEILQNVAKGVYSISEQDYYNLSKNSIDLMKKLLTINPEKRISAEEALNHPWLKENNTKELYNQIEDQAIIKNLLNNLKNYKRGSIMQDTALAYLVHNFPQIPDAINACKLFNQIDVDNDGKITKDELYKGLKGKIKIKHLKKEINFIFGNLDMDGNGYIEYEEFVRAAVNKQFFMSDEVIQFAFKFFDKDNSGEITCDEIREVFEDSVIKKSKEDISLQKIIEEVDANGDGIISYEEFAIIMKKLIVQKK